MQTSRKSAHAALRLIIVSAVLAWLLFVAGLYLNTVVENGYTADQLWGEDAIGLIYPSVYMTFLAIAVLAIGAVIGKRNMSRLAGAHPAGTALARPVHRFASLVILITLVLAAIAAISVFLSNFYSDSDGVQVLPRVFNVYVPILLFTALAVATLLTGFVFMRGSTQAPDRAGEAPVAATPHVATAEHTSGLPIAWAYTIPIVGVAIALILGLIVYDITQTALEVWVWVIILAIVGLGIVLGGAFAQRGIRESAAPDNRGSGVGAGARHLAFVLAIVYTGVVTIMSLSYGVTATEQLKVQPSFSVSVYDENWMMIEGTESRVPAETAIIQVDGYDLERKSDVRVTLEPAGNEILHEVVSSDGYVFLEGDFGDAAEPGEATLVATAISAAGEALELELDVVLTEDGQLEVPNESMISHYDETATVLPPSPGWLLSDLLPALLLLAFAAVVTHLTLAIRHPDRDEGHEDDSIAVEEVPVPKE